MRYVMLICASALATTGGCMGTRGGHEFTIPAAEIGAAWAKVQSQEMRQARDDGTEPLWHPMPSFSDAHCKWTNVGREAACRYAQSIRPSQKPHYSSREAVSRVMKRADGWDFGF